MPVVSSGEATSYNSDSKQTIPRPIGHRVEIEEAVALAASFFLQPSLFACCTFFSHLVFGRHHFRRDSSHVVARRDVLLIRRKQRPERVRDLRGHLITDDDNRKFRAKLSRVHDQSDVEKLRDILGRSFSRLHRQAATAPAAVLKLPPVLLLSENQPTAVL
jgi:hypothetical protein